MFFLVSPFVAVTFVFGNVEDNYLDLPLVATPVHLFNFAFVLWLVPAVFMVVASLLTRPANAELVGPYVYRHGLLTSSGAVEKR